MSGGARNLNWKMRRCGPWTLSRRWDREFDPFLFESIGTMEGISMREKFMLKNLGNFSGCRGRHSRTGCDIPPSFPVPW